MTFWRGVLKLFKRPRKPTAEKSKSENPRRKRPIVGKYGIQSTNEMAFKGPATLRASFRFPAIRFDASTLLLFSGFTHAHAKCPPVLLKVDQNQNAYISFKRGGSKTVKNASK